MLHTMRRKAIAALTVLTAVGALGAAAVPANASDVSGFRFTPAQAQEPVKVKGAASCEAMVAGYGYPVRPKTKAACANAEPEPAPYGKRLECQLGLEAAGLTANEAIGACWARP